MELNTDVKIYERDLISIVQIACKYITVFIVGLQTNVYRTVSSPFSGFVLVSPLVMYVTMSSVLVHPW